MRPLALRSSPSARGSVAMRLDSAQPFSALHRSASAAALAALMLFSPLQDTPLLPAQFHGAVQARELASGSGSKVNKDPLSLLRLGLPNQPKELRELQLKLEECADQLSRLLIPTANSALGTAKGVLKGKSAAILKAVPASSAARGQELLAGISADVADISSALSAGTIDKAQEAAARSLLKVTELEEIIATAYQQPPAPAEFAKLPYLKGRATIEWEVKRPGGMFNVEGSLYDKLQMTTIVDGYTAPITAGNFVDIVSKGFYDGFTIQRSDGFVVQTGDPKEAGRSKKNGFVPEGSDDVRIVPLEVFVKGDKAPIYSATFDDDSRGGYASVLPFNAYGALGMAREEYEVDSASSQFFWLLFDSDLTPAGKNLLDGRYACFGYTVDGARLLSDVKEGDVIVSAKVTSGLSGLVLPK